MAADDRQNPPGSSPASSQATVSDKLPAAIAEAPVASEQQKPYLSPLAVFGVFAVAIALVYGIGARAPFVHDDGASIFANHSIVRLWPLVGSPGPLNPVKDLPTSGRPLVNLSLALNYYLGRHNPIGYHLFNYFVHALNATLLWAFTRRVLTLEYFRGAFDRQAGWLAFAIALVWALHPLQTQSVEYVTQRTELLLALCYLSTMYASLRYLTTTAPRMRNRWLAAAAVSCFAGMACKEVMATAPLMVALLDHTLITRSWRRSAEDSWPLYLALAAGWLLLIALNVGGPRSASAGFQEELPAHIWWLTQCKVLLMYVRLAFWPWPLLMHYELPRLETFGAAWPWVLPVAAAMLATLILLYFQRATGFLAAWFFLILSPTLVVPIVTEVAAERRLYLPLAAIVAAVIIGAFQLVESIARRAQPEAPVETRDRRSAEIVVMAAAAVAAVCGVASAVRVNVYNDVVALWQSTLDAQPDNVVAHVSISEALHRKGLNDEAMEHMQKALALAPESYMAQQLAGTLLIARGKNAEGIEHFRKVVQLKPNSASALNNLALALSATGQTDQAVTLYQEALRMDPDYVEAHNNLATALANQGKFDEALKEYEIAVRFQPDLAGAHSSMGIILLNAGRLPEAIEHLEIAARLEPTADAYTRLAIALAQAQQFQKSLQAVDRAIELARGSQQSAMIDQLQGMRAKLQAAQPGLR